MGTAGRVLVVEDSPGLRSLLETLLTRPLVWSLDAGKV